MSAAGAARTVAAGGAALALLLLTACGNERPAHRAAATTIEPTTTTRPAETAEARPLPCPLTAAAEGCWASSTGVPGWTKEQILAGQSPLDHVTADVTISEAGTVLSDKWLDGCISVRAKNVTIQRVFVHTTRRCKGGDNGNAGSAIDMGQDQAIVSGVQIVDTEVDGMDDPLDRVGIGGSGWSCLRCDVHGFAKNVWPNTDVSITDSYLHDPARPASGAHVESVMFNGGSNLTIRHSWLKASGPVEVVTGAVAIVGGSPGTGVTVDSSYLEGTTGTNILAGGSVVDHVVITNNALSPNNGWNSTQFGTHFDERLPGNVWQNNYDSETLAPVGAPSR